jgi:hypothetical protein
MIVSRTLSTPVCEAASISCTSIERLSEISRHEDKRPGSSVRQGVAVGSLRLVAVQRLGEQTRGSGFAHAARAGKR